MLLEGDAEGVGAGHRIVGAGVELPEALGRVQRRLERCPTGSGDWTGRQSGSVVHVVGIVHPQVRQGQRLRGLVQRVAHRGVDLERHSQAQPVVDHPGYLGPVFVDEGLLFDQRGHDDDFVGTQTHRFGSGIQARFIGHEVELVDHADNEGGLVFGGCRVEQISIGEEHSLQRAGGRLIVGSQGREGQGAGQLIGVEGGKLI